MIEQWKRIRRFIPFLVAAFSTLLLFWLYPEQLLVGAMVLSILLLLIMKQDQERGDV
jgi:predicted branched-subunit amino acid permease